MARWFWYVGALVVARAAGNVCRPADREALKIYRRDGLAILKNFIDEDTLVAVQRELERVVDTYAEAAPVDVKSLDFTHKYAALHSVHRASAHETSPMAVFAAATAAVASWAPATAATAAMSAVRIICRAKP